MTQILRRLQDAVVAAYRDGNVAGCGVEVEVSDAEVLTECHRRGHRGVTAEAPRMTPAPLPPLGTVVNAE
ncbi:hypothetical protein [Nocardioides sp. NPDC006273]|uniref:hypothetical protein n=1 Tax=Nocardioides sp. NPDC006273 TaxID=3155598 RepID=UPI0033A53131